MNENEVRIGNWVKSPIEYSGGEEVVIGHLGVDKDGYNHYIDHCNPIPVTEDWLVRFGAYWSGDQLLLNIGVFQLSSFLPMLPGGEYRMCFKDIFIKEVKYVHELQNLYFALTGKELVLSQ